MTEESFRYISLFNTRKYYSLYQIRNKRIQNAGVVLNTWYSFLNTSNRNSLFGVQGNKDIFIYTASQPANQSLCECLSGRQIHKICIWKYDPVNNRHVLNGKRQQQRWVLFWKMCKCWLYLDWLAMLSFKDRIVLLQTVAHISQTDRLLVRHGIPHQLHISWKQRHTKTGRVSIWHISCL